MIKTHAKDRASDQITRQLRRMITTLELEPGAAVTEAYLVERLDCGRTPLREALHRLAHENLLVINPRRGVTVANMGIIDFGLLLETLVAVESFVVRQAAERVSDEKLAVLNEIIARSEGANEMGDFAAWVDLDFEFHTTIAEATGNRFTVRALIPLYRQLARFTYLGVSRTGTASQPLGDHQRIVAALRTRDPGECEQAFREHARAGKARILASF